jgi:hypothetical protein
LLKESFNPESFLYRWVDFNHRISLAKVESPRAYLAATILPMVKTVLMLSATTVMIALFVISDELLIEAVPFNLFVPFDVGEQEGSTERELPIIGPCGSSR